MRGPHSQPRIHVLIADATRLGSHLLADAVSRDRRLEVTKAVSSYVEFAEAVASCKLDVLLISARLDENPKKGFEALRELRGHRPEVKAVMLLDTSKPETVVAAFQAGAKGIFCRNENESLTTLCKCIRSVHAGQIWAKSKELEFVLDALASHALSRVDTSEFEDLPKRERDVIRGISEGLSNRDIAKRLKLSEHTVKNYLFNIFDKLGVSSRLELMFKVLSQPQARAGSICIDPEISSGSGSSLASLRSAADQGFPWAQLALGECYRNGLGIPRDKIRAYAWFLLAGRTSGHFEAASNGARSGIAAEMTPAEVSEAERQAAEWISEANEMKKPPGNLQWVVPSSSDSASLGRRRTVFRVYPDHR